MSMSSGFRDRALVMSCGCGKGIVVCSCMASPLLLRTEGGLDHLQDTPPWPSATPFDPNSPREGGGAMPAKQAYGMDQDFYSWSPIIARPVLRWPDNARVALAIIVNLEHWDWEVPPHTPLAVSPLGGPEGCGAGTGRLFPISAATATTSTAIASASFASSPSWTSTASQQPWRSTRPSPTTTRS